ncbi:MAG: hypothetical protein ACI9LM_003714 [Alteromonadaceae bacterium]|jgi:hypothetical protein
MKTKIIAVIGVCMIYFITSAAQATLISVVPQSQNVNQGEEVIIDIIISELTNGSALSISSFDININFDATLLRFSNISFGDQLNFGFGSWQNSSELSAGIFNFSEFSFDDFATIDALQASKFTLASLTFDTKSFGLSALTAHVNGLGDSIGNGLNSRMENSNFNITAVPEPTALLLFIFGILSIVIQRLKFSQ